MSSPPILCFVGTSRGNAYMNELLSGVAHAVRGEGVETRFAFDAFPPLEEPTVYVVIPHEYFACAPADGHPTDAQLARTISFCVEQPGTSWFEMSWQHAARTAAVVDIQRSSLKTLQERGLTAEHFQLGYTDCWDRWGGEQGVDRPIDVLYMGSASKRRDRYLASYGQTLWPRETRLLVPPEAPKTQRRPDYLMDEEKWRCLCSTKTLLHLHRQDKTFFEWVRVLQAISNGCVVVSEQAADCLPLVPGEHFLSGDPANLGLLADGLLEDEEQLRSIRADAYEFVRAELSMQPAAQRLIALAEEVRRTQRKRRRRREPHENLMYLLSERVRGAAVRDPWVRGVLADLAAASERSDKQIAAIKRLSLADLEIRRTLRSQQLAGEGEDPDSVQTIATTPSYRDASPRVSVVIPVYNHAREVERALRSVVRGDYTELEVVLLDDASSDDSAGSVARFFAEHPYLPGILLQGQVNRGPAAARNVLLSWARGEFVFALDADNEIFPPGLRRLVVALDGEPEATFAYSMLEEARDGEAVGLRSALPWEPERLRDGNYIDTMALLRRRELIELGGYEEDLRLHGWEDYDLWCRFAENGHQGTFVPQILGRYHRSKFSTLTVTDLDDQEMLWLLRQRYPRVMQGAAVA